MSHVHHVPHFAANGFDPIERAAQRRAGRKLGWFIHATVYLLVNLGLMGLSFSHGRHWSIYSAFFWGIGLLAHGMSVWLRPTRGALWHRMVQKEREALLRDQGKTQSDNASSSH